MMNIKIILILSIRSIQIKKIVYFPILKRKFNFPTIIINSVVFPRKKRDIKMEKHLKNNPIKNSKSSKCKDININ